MNRKTGVMEAEASVREIIDLLARHPEGIKCEVINKSKNHDGETMLRLYDNDETYNLEVSCKGMFAYIFDDGVS